MNRAEKEQTLGYVILGAIALAIILLIGFVIAGASNSAREMEEISQQREAEETTAANEEATRLASITKLELLKDITGVEDTYMLTPDVTVAEDVDENTDKPFRVVVINNSLPECDNAKRSTYDAMHRIYTNERLKPLVQQVTYTATSHLVTALGRVDAGMMTLDDTWSGHSNFYRNYFDNGFEVESRNQPAENPTWVLSINDCK